MGNKNSIGDRKLNLPFIQSVDNDIDSSLQIFTEKLTLLGEISIWHQTYKISPGDLSYQPKEEKETKDILKYTNDIYKLIHILADRIIFPTCNVNEYEIAIAVLNALVRLYTYPLAAKKTLPSNLVCLIKFLDSATKSEIFVSNIIMVIHLGFQSYSDESFRLNIYIQLEKLGYFTKTIDFLIHWYSNNSMSFYSVLILQDILWILRRQSSFPNTLMLQFKLRQHLRQSSVLINLFELSRHPVAAVQQLSSLVLNELLKTSDKASCISIQDLSRTHGAILWTLFRFVTYLLAFMELKGSKDIPLKNPTSNNELPNTSSTSSSESCPAGTQRLGLMLPLEYQEMLEHHFPHPEEPCELSHCLEVTGQLLMKLCMGNTTNTQFILRAIPEGMSIFLFPQATSNTSSDANIPESLNEYTEKMECWLRWHVLLAALGQRVESLRVVWNRLALDHLRIQLRRNVIGLDRLRELRYEVWDPLTVDISYPMLDALIPVKGVFLRILLQDLESDHAAIQSTITSTSSEHNSSSSSNNNDALLNRNELLEVSLLIVDRAILYSTKLQDAETIQSQQLQPQQQINQQPQLQPGQEEEEIMLLCLRVLLLLHQRWPEETRPGIPVGSLFLLLNTAIRRCLSARKNFTTEVTTNTLDDVLLLEHHKKQQEQEQLHQQRSYTAMKTSLLWLQRCLRLLQLRLTGSTRSDLQYLEGMGGLTILLRMLTDIHLLPVLRGAGERSNVDVDEVGIRLGDKGLSNGGNASMLCSTINLLLELTVQSSHVALHLCQVTNLTLIIELMVQLGIYSEHVNEEKLKITSNNKNAIDLMSNILRRLLVVNPFAMYQHAASMGLVRAIIVCSIDASGCGVIGQSASELLVDLLALDVQDRGKGRNKGELEYNATVSGSEKLETTIVSDFLRFLPLQIFRLAICSSPDVFRSIFNQNDDTTTSTKVCSDLVWNDLIRSQCRSLIMNALYLTYPYLTTFMYKDNIPDKNNENTFSNSTSGLQPQICGMYLRRLIIPDIPFNMKFVTPVDIYRLSNLLLTQLAMVMKDLKLCDNKEGNGDFTSNISCCCLSPTALPWTKSNYLSKQHTPNTSNTFANKATTITMQDIKLHCVSCNSSYLKLDQTEKDALLLLSLLALQQLHRHQLINERSTYSKHIQNNNNINNNNSNNHSLPPSITTFSRSQYTVVITKLHHYLKEINSWDNHSETNTNFTSNSSSSLLSSNLSKEKSSQQDVLLTIENIISQIEHPSVMTLNENIRVESLTTSEGCGEEVPHKNNKLPVARTPVTHETRSDDNESQDSKFALKSSNTYSSNSNRSNPESSTVSSPHPDPGTFRAISCSLLAITQIVEENSLSEMNLTDDDPQYPSNNNSGSNNVEIKNDVTQTTVLQEVLPLILQILNVCKQFMTNKDFLFSELNATMKSVSRASHQLNSQSQSDPQKECLTTSYKMEIVIESARASAVALTLLAQMATVVKNWTQGKQREVSEVKSAGSGNGTSGIEVVLEITLEPINGKGILLTTLNKKEWIDCLCTYCNSNIAHISPRSTYSALMILQTILLCAYPQSLNVIDKLCETGFPIILVDMMLTLACAPPVVAVKKQPPMLHSSSLYESGTHTKSSTHQSGPKPRAMSLRSQSSSSSANYVSTSYGEGCSTSSAMTPKDILKQLQRELVAELQNTIVTTTIDSEETERCNRSNSNSSIGLMKHAAAVECIMLLRLIVCHGVYSGGEIMGFMGEPLPKYLACFIPVPLLHTLLTDPELGLSILGTVSSIRCPVAIWSSEMTVTLRASISREISVIHTTIFNPTAASSSDSSSRLWDMTSSIKRLTDLHPVLTDEVTVEGVYILMLLEPHHEDDIGVRHLPRFVESLQASLATSKKVFEHMKTSPNDLRKVGRRDAILSQLAIKQRVLENILRKHPELGYSNLLVDWED